MGHEGFQSVNVSPPPATGDLTDGKRSDDGVASELFSGVDVGDVDFDGWEFAVQNGVEDRVTDLSECACVDDDAAGVVRFLLYPVDDGSFVV